MWVRRSAAWPKSVWCCSIRMSLPMCTDMNGGTAAADASLSHPTRQPSRREVLYGLGASLGSVACSSLMAAEEARNSPLSPRAGHLPAKAKSCIFLMMEGGPSHIDTFDPKPKLVELHLQEFVREGQMKSAMESG